MPSADYHDYFIKDGRFIGAFEDMYRHCADPWLQDTAQRVEEDVALALLGGREYRRILDLGCGKGRFAERIRRATAGTVFAADVSPSAVAAAHARYPALEFTAVAAPDVPFASGAFDLVVTSELLWCVLPRLADLFMEIRRILAPGGRYLIVQTFYQPGQQRYGNDVMEQPSDLLRRLPFRLVHCVEVNRLSNHKLVALVEAEPA